MRRIRQPGPRHAPLQVAGLTGSLFQQVGVIQGGDSGEVPTPRPRIVRFLGNEHVWAILRKRGFKIHVAAVGVNPDADDRARNMLDGWARDRKGIRGGSRREAKLREEFAEVSRAFDHGDSRVIERYGSFHRTSLRYVELKDLLATPAPYRVRVDTFEIWRSRRIFPDGASLYEAPP